MASVWTLWAVLGAGLGGSATPDVAVEASYEAPKAGAAQGSVVVRFGPRTPDIRIDQKPAPRLKLEPESVLVDRQAAETAGVHTPVLDPDFAGYIDPGAPVRFAVAPDPKARKGSHVVRGTVNFAYCSKSQGWCKRGKEPVELNVTIR